MLTLPFAGGPVVAVAYSPDGRRLAAAGWGGSVRLYDLSTYQLVHAWTSSEAHAFCVAFAPDGQSLAAGFGRESGLVDWWHADTGRRLDRWVADPRNVRGVAFAPHGQTLYTGGAAGIVRAWELPTGRATGSWYTQGDPIVALTLDAAGERFAALSARPSVHVWPVGGSRRKVQDARLIASGPRALQFAPSGGLLAGGVGTHLLLWDVNRETTPQLIEAGVGGVRGVAQTSDGRVLAAHADGAVTVWDARRGGSPRRLEWGAGELASIAVSPDGTTAAAGAADGIVLWDVDG